ncbi:TolB family protein [Planomonospora corallina]|uniref:TolB family protein n=1 Tax=Planomonospora corallina TaxID=1806052 RepID=A0ABV8I618_9ACTN
MPLTRGTHRLLRGGVAATALTVLLAVPLVPAHAAAPADIRLPGTSVTVREETTDPARVTAYSLKGAAYLRRGAGFVKRSGDTEVTVAPKGARALAVAASYRDGYDSVVLIDVATGKGTRIRTVDKPLVANSVRWARTADKAVLTVRRKTASGWATTGFVIVDATARTARQVTAEGVDPAAVFRWSPDGTELVSGHRGGTRFHGPDGSVRRTLTGTGTPVGGEDAFSPSGRRLATWCPSSYAEHVCVWERTTRGAAGLAARVNVRPESLWGWWDEKHLVAVLASGGTRRVVLVDLTGRTVRTLAALPAADWEKKIYLSYTRK